MSETTAERDRLLAFRTRIPRPSGQGNVNNLYIEYHAAVACQYTIFRKESVSRDTYQGTPSRLFSLEGVLLNLFRPRRPGALHRETKGLSGGSRASATAQTGVLSFRQQPLATRHVPLSYSLSYGGGGDEELGSRHARPPARVTTARNENGGRDSGEPRPCRH